MAYRSCLERTIDGKAKSPPGPELPFTFAENSADLWPAVRDAVATPTIEPTRYALNCLQCEVAEISPPRRSSHLIQSGLLRST